MGEQWRGEVQEGGEWTSEEQLAEIYRRRIRLTDHLLLPSLLFILSLLPLLLDPPSIPSPSLSSSPSPPSVSCRLPASSSSSRLQVM